MQDANQIIKAHDKLIRSLAASICRVEADDLIQEGRMAVLDVLEKYDPSRGVQFWTYARPFVFGAMLRYLKKEAKEPQPTDEEELEAVDESPNPEERIVEAETRAEKVHKAAQAFASLSSEDQDLIRKMFDGEQSTRSIAKDLGVGKSEGARRCKAALTNLKEKAA